MRRTKTNRIERVARVEEKKALRKSCFRKEGVEQREKEVKKRRFS
jgi:hypothetical protein